MSAVKALGIIGTSGLVILVLGLVSSVLKGGAAWFSTLLFLLVLAGLIAIVTRRVR